MQESTNKHIFTCDREWWESLNEKEKNYWLDWAESCGAGREPHLCDRNPDYPNLIATPAVSLGTFKTEDLPEEFFDELEKQLKEIQNEP